jgi:CubicO group peptidase (beta-lactamase class C family)
MGDVVLRPLGLSATAVDRAEEVVIGRASGYAPHKPDGSFENARCIEIAEAGGAGAMRSTGLDLCRWHALLLSNRLFARKYLDLMLAPGRLRDGRLSGANRFSSSDASYGDVQYACGLFISAPSDPHPSILHYGAIDGFAAVLQTYLKAGVTFAVLCNGDIGPAMPFRAIRKVVEQNFLPR